jgi:HD-GYP domain-containing protein (c-di-GMP phosphodiesterase class II)
MPKAGSNSSFAALRPKTRISGGQRVPPHPAQEHRMPHTIAVEELRVGMYVHLDGGWLSHPFPLSSFRLAASEQIETLRGLGLARVRWDPAKSELQPTPEEAAAAAEAAARAAASPPSAEQQAEQRRREWGALQREAARRCERQQNEAAQAWREATDAIHAQPALAGGTAAALTQAMLGKMLGTEDVVIRLVAGGGDRAAAHAINTSVISLLIGRTLGLDEAEMQDLGVGALMHDTGKLDVAERFRHAEEGFTAAEINAYRDHVAKGVLLGHRMGLRAGALAVLAQHHEHADGSGFPRRLAGEQIVLASRIVAIVNRFDNLCNPGSRALALTPHEAVSMLFAQGRSRYDAAVLSSFIRMMGVYPAGSLVQLTDDRYAMVMGVNSTRPLKPRVLVHDARHPGADTHWIDLEQERQLGIRRSLPANKLPAAALQALDPRPRVAYFFEPVTPEVQTVSGAA